jgi:hypothetical protein
MEPKILRGMPDLIIYLQGFRMIMMMPYLKREVTTKP